jgi:hypothetical protein
MKGLYANTRAQAATQGVRSAAVKAGIPKVGIAKIEETARKEWLPILDGFGVSEHEASYLLGMLLKLEIDKARGRLTDETAERWGTEVNNDMRARGLTNKQIGEERAAMLARLKKERPDMYAVLERSWPIGWHPQVMRHLMRWHDNRSGEEQRKAFSKKSRFSSPATPAPSGMDSATALASLGKSPLGSNLDA